MFLKLFFSFGVRVLNGTELGPLFIVLFFISGSLNDFDFLFSLRRAGIVFHFLADD